MKAVSAGACNTGDYNFYVNGIFTTREDVEEVARKIERISGRRTEARFNDSMTAEKAVEIFGLVGCGAALVIYAAEETRKNKRVEVIDCVTGGAGTFLMLWGAYAFYQVQERKDELGQELANKVLARIRRKPKGKVTIILHSQGADIGQKAINILGDYFHRRTYLHPNIRIINLGGKVHLGGDFPVTNLEFNNDWVAKVASLFNRKIVTDLKGKGCISHSAPTYVEAPRFVAEVRN